MLNCWNSFLLVDGVILQALSICDVLIKWINFWFFFLSLSRLKLMCRYIVFIYVRSHCSLLSNNRCHFGVVVVVVVNGWWWQWCWWCWWWRWWNIFPVNSQKSSLSLLHVLLYINIPFFHSLFPMNIEQIPILYSARILKNDRKTQKEN